MKLNFIKIWAVAAALVAGSWSMVAADRAQMSGDDYVKENYCTETEGLELKYVNLDKAGEVEGYFVMEMVLCDGTLAGGNFAYEQYYFNEKQEPLMKDNHIRMDVVIHGPGQVESTLHGMGKVMKTQNRMTKGDISSVPPVLKEGMQLADSEVKMHVDNMNFSLHTLERQVEKKVKLTTKAGTFDCFLITETQKMKTVGTQTEKLKTWYAKGIGVVKQEFYNKKGEPVRSMELISVSVK